MASPFYRGLSAPVTAFQRLGAVAHGRRLSADWRPFVAARAHSLDQPLALAAVRRSTLLDSSVSS